VCVLFQTTVVQGYFNVADKYSGTIRIGGSVTEEELEKIQGLFEQCLDFLSDGELRENGTGDFVECEENAFKKVIAFCNRQNIALSLVWHKKRGADSVVEYWLAGSHKEYLANCDGDVVVKLSDLESHTDTSVADFIEELEVPVFPPFELVKTDKSEPQGFDTAHLSGDALVAAKAVLKALGPNPCGSGVRAFWTPDEWIARNEKFGTDSILILCHDGGDLAVMCNWDYGQYELFQKLEKRLKKHGYYCVQQTSWYSAVYRIPTSS